jgi:hypothetical protein
MQRRRWREHPSVWWAGFAGLGVVAGLMRSWRAGLLVLVLWCFYQFCLVPTVCRIRTREGWSCTDPVRGRLFACTPAHQEVKNDALWRLAGLRNPFRTVRPPDPTRTTGELVVSPPVRARLAQTDRVMLALAIGGTLITIAGAISGYL